MMQDQEASEPDQQQANDIAQDISKIYSALTKISEELGGLAEIRRTTASVELLPNLLNIEGRREIERAHRIAGQRPATGDRPRPILARFLRSSDRDAVLRAARNKGKLSWGNTTIMLFPDYSRATQMKRDKFKEYKKKLHEREVRFRMLFPAKLRIETGQGERAFECPREAMAFIDAMQCRVIGRGPWVVST
ncbi:hypothetical protein D5F01_LYC22386 [Larimichthys crocea]|uniref:LINE-1 type transposase domain-containing protein 1 n=1 Tax=Larimichthys crocea TaxID=215358 RepID=A0A6G0HIG0_LARCR|nr:hypothetical protein D5F01_LYC22386 [Larimichthys crocea]